MLQSVEMTVKMWYYEPRSFEIDIYKKEEQTPIMDNSFMVLILDLIAIVQNAIEFVLALING